jgi:hypothetical protein
MYTVLIFTLIVSVILWSLYRTTEKVLAIRQKQREEGKKPIIYL